MQFVIISKVVAVAMWWWLVYFFLLLFSFYYIFYFGRVRRFWEKLNVPHTKPLFPLGDFQRGGFSNNSGVLLKKFYDEFSGERFFGIWMFTNPVLVVRDPELIKAMFVKDFGYFHDRGVYYNEEVDPLSAHMFNLEGAKWKAVREKLSPTFTSGKMKMMFPLLLKCGQELEDYLGRSAERKEMIDAREVSALFMTDVISICAFGIETNSLKNPKAEFRVMGKKVFEPCIRNFFLFYLQFSAPKLASALRLRLFPKTPADFFMAAFREVVNYRTENKVDRNDFLKLLMDLLREDGSKPKNVDKLTFENAAAQAFVFFIAGFETSSSVVEFAMFELAKNPDIQEKLRKEITTVLAQNGGKATYESLQNMPYLDKVIDETLRKYCVVPLLQRKCVQDYKIPDSNVILPKGTMIQYPIFAVQTDEKYFPDPEKFDPERFTEEEKQKRPTFAYLPFGDGPRNCIGKRFGMMQVRLAIVIFLQHFKYELPEKLDTITFDPRTFVLFPKEEVRLKITRL